MIPLFSDQEFQSSYHLNKLPVKCINCEKTFYASKHDIISSINKKGKSTCNFCSNSCQNAYQNPPVFVKCLQCEKEFKKHPNQIKRYSNHFCSRSCAATYNNTHKTTGNRRSKFEIWLEKQLTSLYPDLTIHYNKKDAIGSELDIYVPSLKIAFELNGIFHYEPIYGKDKLGRIQSNDENKFQSCIEKNISLCVIDLSSMKNFKTNKAEKFLNIITQIIDNKH